MIWRTTQQMIWREIYRQQSTNDIGWLVDNLVFTTTLGNFQPLRSRDTQAKVRFEPTSCRPTAVLNSWAIEDRRTTLKLWIQVNNLLSTKMFLFSYWTQFSIFRINTIQFNTSLYCNFNRWGQLCSHFVLFYVQYCLGEIP